MVGWLGQKSGNRAVRQLGRFQWDTRGTLGCCASGTVDMSRCGTVPPAGKKAELKAEAALLESGETEKAAVKVAQSAAVCSKGSRPQAKAEDRISTGNPSAGSRVVVLPGLHCGEHEGGNSWRVMGELVGWLVMWLPVRWLAAG